jgi:hypothetical protein
VGYPGTTPLAEGGPWAAKAAAMMRDRRAIIGGNMTADIFLRVVCSDDGSANFIRGICRSPMACELSQTSCVASIAIRIRRHTGTKSFLHFRFPAFSQCLLSHFCLALRILIFCVWYNL